MGFLENAYPTLQEKIKAQIPPSGTINKEAEDDVVNTLLEELLAPTSRTSRLITVSMSLSSESLYLETEAARRSIYSNSPSTALPNFSSELIVEDDYDYRKYEFSIIESKPLLLLPSSISGEFNPYFIEYPGSYMTLNSLLKCLSRLHYSVPSLSISKPPINDYIPACLPRQYTPHNRNRHHAMCRNTYFTWRSHRSPSLAACSSFGVSNERKTRMVER